jgi:hypothetical protein
MHDRDDRLTRIRRLERQERDRVRDVVQRDRDYHSAEIIRAAAEIEVASGKTVSITDAVLEPTPEWLAKGNVSTFTPRLEDGTVKTVRGYRRGGVSMVVKLCFDGKITDDQLIACRWYRVIHDASGLEGRYKTANFSLAGNVGGGGGLAQHPMAAHEWEAEARQLYRQARMHVNPRFLPVFENVVIKDLSLRAAATAARRDNSRLLPNFRFAAQQIVDFCAKLKLDLDAIAKRMD